MKYNEKKAWLRGTLLANVIGYHPSLSATGISTQDSETERISPGAAREVM
jgi:hypothetical protein